MVTVLKKKLNVCFLLKHNIGDCVVHLDGLYHTVFFWWWLNMLLNPLVLKCVPARRRSRTRSSSSSSRNRRTSVSPKWIQEETAKLRSLLMKIRITFSPSKANGSKSSVIPDLFYKAFTLTKVAPSLSCPMYVRCRVLMAGKPLVLPWMEGNYLSNVRIYHTLNRDKYFLCEIYDQVQGI